MFTECTSATCSSTRPATPTRRSCAAPFNRCNFFEAEFTGCKLVGSTLRPVRPAAAADRSAATGRSSRCRAPTCAGCSSTGIRMREVDLTGANCDGRGSTGVDLSGAQLHRARLVRCRPAGQRPERAGPDGDRIRGALIDAEQALRWRQSLGFDSSAEPHRLRQRSMPAQLTAVRRSRRARAQTERGIHHASRRDCARLTVLAKPCCPTTPGTSGTPINQEGGPWQRSLSVWSRNPTPGERRVAVVPEVVPKLTRPRAGRAGRAAMPGRRPGSPTAPTPKPAPAGRRRTRSTAPASWCASHRRRRPGSPALAAGTVLLGLLSPLGQPGAGRSGAAGRGDRGQPGPAAAHAEPGPVDGRADLAGQRRRLQGGAGRRRRLRRLLPDADDRGRHRPPAQVLVLGAGVAGLQAIGTARRLGALVTGYDVRDGGPRRHRARPARRPRPARDQLRQRRGRLRPGADRRRSGRPSRRRCRSASAASTS